MQNVLCDCGAEGCGFESASDYQMKNALCSHHSECVSFRGMLKAAKDG